MTRLLVSVRDAAEAGEALAGGADFIDVKEPHRGALGAASIERLLAVARQVGRSAPLSAAAGELLAPPPADWLATLANFGYLKVGLSGCAHLSDWPRRWEAFVRQRPPHLRVVAVGYVDHRRADSPPPQAVLEVACRHRWPWLLLDTFDKSAGGLFDHLTEAAVAELLAEAHCNQMLVALAGSLTLADIPRAVQLGADIVAVRGAACVGGRAGTVTAAQVRQLADRMRFATCDSP